VKILSPAVLVLLFVPAQGHPASVAEEYEIPTAIVQSRQTAPIWNTSAEIDGGLPEGKSVSPRGNAQLRSESGPETDEGSPEKNPGSEVKPGAHADEVLKLKREIIELQNKGKLGFRKVILCSKVDGYGRYSPLNPGQRVSRLVLYFEPANVGTLISGDRYIIDCSIDLFIFQGKGKPIRGKKNIHKINRVSRSPVLDLFFVVRVNLKKPVGGSLVLKTVLNDNIKNQSSSITHKLNLKGKKKPRLEQVRAASAPGWQPYR